MITVRAVKVKRKEKEDGGEGRGMKMQKEAKRKMLQDFLNTESKPLTKEADITASGKICKFSSGYFTEGSNSGTASCLRAGMSHIYTHHASKPNRNRLAYSSHSHSSTKSACN